MSKLPPCDHDGCPPTRCLKDTYLLNRDTWTARQRELFEKHGTPYQFSIALGKAIGEITCEEAETARDDYEQEWNNAGLVSRKP